MTVPVVLDNQPNEIQDLANRIIKNEKLRYQKRVSNILLKNVMEI